MMNAFTANDIARLKKKRQLNVQEQNALTEHAQRSETNYWRVHAIPSALRNVGLARGIDWDRSIIVDLHIDYPGVSNLFGMLLSQDERFIRFDIDADEKHETILTVFEWADCTAEQNLNAHNRGTGMGKGALALLIRREILGLPPPATPARTKAGSG